MRWIRVGVDQSGAVRRIRGELRPVPLPAAFLHHEAGALSLELAALESLSLRAIQGALGVEKGAKQGAEVGDERRYLILLDCVLGLAERCFPLPAGGDRFTSDLFLEAHQSSGYGRAAAETFFAKLRPQGELPVRDVERRVGANSVFLTRPYQKNIQTGTFRIWKDLGRSLKEEGQWFRLWPHEAIAESGTGPTRPDVGDSVAWLAEGYPSWIWRDVLGSRHRDPELLAHVLRGLRRGGKLRISTADLARVHRSQDWADAVVLALFAGQGPSGPVRLTRTEALRLRREGWIYGQRWSPLFG